MEDYFAQIKITNMALKYLKGILQRADDIWDIYRETFSKEKAQRNYGSYIYSKYFD